MAGRRGETAVTRLGPLPQGLASVGSTYYIVDTGEGIFSTAF